MEAYLDQSVEQVSRPNPSLVLAGALSCRGYLLKGYGVVFVLPPRRLPGPAVMRAAGGRRGSMGWSGVVMVREGTRRPAGLRELEAQVQAFQQEALEQWDEFERAFLDVQERLAAAEAGVGAPMPRPTPVLAPAPPPSPPAPTSPAPPSDPAALDAMPAPAVPSAPVAMPAPEAAPASPAAPTTPAGFPVPPRPPAGPLAPWRYWVEEPGDEREARSPERLVTDTREAVVKALEAHGSLLTSLAPDETVTVVVDFVAGTPFLDDDARPARSLTLRVRKRDLDERMAGRLGADELRRRIEAAEY
jgi:hypothetical protein